MIRKIFTLATMSAVVALTAFIGCGDDTIFETQPMSTVRVNLDNYVGQKGAGGSLVDLDRATLQYTSPHGVDYSIATLRYIISNVRFHRTDGTTHGMDDIHFRDESVPATRDFAMQIPQGDYDGISFTFGVDEAKNIRLKYSDYERDGLPPGQFEDDMFWSNALGENLGYHYMKIEGDYEETPGGTKSGYLTHTGARQCRTGVECGPMLGDQVNDVTPHHHYLRVVLSFTKTEFGKDGKTVTLNLDHQKWYEDPTPGDPPAGDGVDTSHDWRSLGMMQMIMANLPAQDRIMVNGPQVSSVEVQ